MERLDLLLQCTFCLFDRWVNYAERAHARLLQLAERGEHGPEVGLERYGLVPEERLEIDELAGRDHGLPWLGWDGAVGLGAMTPEGERVAALLCCRLRGKLLLDLWGCWHR